MLWTSFCLLGSCALIAMSYRRLWALRAFARTTSPWLRRSATPNAARGGVSSEAASADARTRVAELNEATLELRAHVEQPALVPRGCAKVAFLLGALVSLMQAAQALGEPDSRTWVGPLGSLVGGTIGALGCAYIGRVAEAEARRLRQEWSALIRRSAQDVPS
jgi:hypothetical protein